MLVLLFSFTGCARTEEQVEYNEAMMGQVTEFLVEYCANADEAVIEHWRGLSEFRLQQELAGAELPFTPESFLAALDSFEAGEEECGAYIEHDDFVYEASKDELRVTACIARKLAPLHINGSLECGNGYGYLFVSCGSCFAANSAAQAEI